MKIAALLLLVLAIAGGGALGLHFKPPPDPAAEAQEIVPEDETAAPGYVTLARQMIVPVVDGGETRALMLFEIAVDVPEDKRDIVHEREPRLRDAFLRIMFEMSHTGAFLETYTDDRTMGELRGKLLAASRLHLGSGVRDVLILDALRQEL